MKPVQILLVEDQAGDILLTRHVRAEQLVPVKVHVAMDGQQAVSMLADPAFLPDLIILYLNIPRISGHELLGQCKLREVPVVVFSSSWNETDARRALELGARDYVRKPNRYRRVHPGALGDAREVGYPREPWRGQANSCLAMPESLSRSLYQCSATS